jgi:PAS domain S-box-containing protein
VAKIGLMAANSPNIMNLERDKFAERRLAEKNWLAAIVESSDDAIIFKDLNGIINTWNNGAERIFGYTAEEVIGKPVTILIPQEYQYEEPGIIARVRRGERIEHYETVRRRKDGELINISLTVSPVKDDEGIIIGASKIARNITDRKQVEQKLAEMFEREKAARQEVEAVARAKDDFIAMLSHELRTPLNPVLLIASDSAQNPELPADVRAQFETILKNVEVEARLIDDLLDLSHINHGKLKLKMQTVDAHAVLREAIQTVRSQIEIKQIQFISNLNAEKHLVLADAVRLQQVFWNILKNAIKFTPSGGRITVETFSTVAGGQFNVKISDTGIGMTPEELDRSFSAFSQGDHIRDKSANYGGLGLGLAITKKLVEFHSGRIQAVSEGRDCGSTFTVEFPLA